MNGFLSYNSHLNLEAASGYYVQIKPRNSSYGLILKEYNSNDYGNIEVTSSGLGLGYNTSGSHLMILTNRNVGIRTSSPQHKLEITWSYLFTSRQANQIWNRIIKHRIFNYSQLHKTAIINNIIFASKF